jgi:hypothetical protein
VGGDGDQGVMRVMGELMEERYYSKDFLARKLRGADARRRPTTDKTNYHTDDHTTTDQTKKLKIQTMASATTAPASQQLFNTYDNSRKITANPRPACSIPAFSLTISTVAKKQVKKNERD